MFAINPFAALSATVPPAVMQAYVVLMIVLVAAGTLFDIVHKGSAKYFFDNWRKTKRKVAQQVGGGELVSIAMKTGLVDVLASGEFCNAKRRVAHLLTMYGFVLHVVSTVVMVFNLSTDSHVAAPLVDRRPDGPASAATGSGSSSAPMSPPRAIRGSASCTRISSSFRFSPASRSGLIWAWLQSRGSRWSRLLFGLYVIATTVLFGSVPWSKFAHMFFKPAAAFEKRVSYANGTRSNLPAPADKPETFGSARTPPQHY